MAGLAGELLRSGARQLGLAEELLALLAAQMVPSGQAAPAVAVELPAAAAVRAAAAVPKGPPSQGSKISYYSVANVSQLVAPARAGRFLLMFAAGGLGVTPQLSFDPISDVINQGITLAANTQLVLDRAKFGDIVSRDWYARINGGPVNLLVMEGFFL